MQLSRRHILAYVAVAAVVVAVGVRYLVLPHAAGRLLQALRHASGDGGTRPGASVSARGLLLGQSKCTAPQNSAGGAACLIC